MLTSGPKSGAISEKIRRSALAGNFSWPLRYFERGELSVSWENQAWIDTPQGLDQDLGRSAATLVLNAEPRWPADKYRAKILEDFLHDATVQKLEDGHPSVPNHKVALLIDGNKLKADPELRKFLEGLSARDLLVELKKKVGNIDNYLMLRFRRIN